MRFALQETMDGHVNDDMARMEVTSKMTSNIESWKKTIRIGIEEELSYYYNVKSCFSIVSFEATLSVYQVFGNRSNGI